MTQFVHLLNSSTVFQSYNMSKLKKNIYFLYVYDNSINTFHMFSLFLLLFLPTPTILPRNKASVNLRQN